jgi:hypothetical protein
MQTYCRRDAALILDEIGRIGIDKCMNALASEYDLSDKFLMETGHLLDIYTLSGIIPMDIAVYNKYIDRLDWVGVTNNIKLDIKGIDFAMTAMFVVILLEQILGGVKNLPSVIIGVGASLLSLLIFGASDFLIPSMAFMLLALAAFKKPISALSKAGGEAK